MCAFGTFLKTVRKETFAEKYFIGPYVHALELYAYCLQY